MPKAKLKDADERAAADAIIAILAAQAPDEEAQRRVLLHVAAALGVSLEPDSTFSVGE